MLSGHKGASVLQPERSLDPHTHTWNEERISRFDCLTRYTSCNTGVSDTILMDGANIKHILISSHAILSHTSEQPMDNRSNC